jgi:hypothetical protein
MALSLACKSLPGTRGAGHPRHCEREDHRRPTRFYSISTLLKWYRASNASVFANWPVARAKSRACRGQGTRHRALQATPVASSTIRVGWRVCTQSTSVSTPLASFATARRSPEGRRATSNWALATSIPTKQGTSLIRTPVRPTLRIRAQWHQTTVRALGVQNVTTHATLRSRWTKAKSVCHVPGLRDGDAPTSPLKDTRLEAVRCNGLFGISPAAPGENVNYAESTLAGR